MGPSDRAEGARPIAVDQPLESPKKPAPGKIRQLSNPPGDGTGSGVMITALHRLRLKNKVVSFYNVG